MKDFLKVGISGVRGIAGETFTPQLAASFARAFGTYVGRGSVVIGRDTRRSGNMTELAVIAGLQSTGCKPILAGIVPTPTVLMLTKALRARGAIAITASHNPAPWNALKFVGEGGIFLTPARAREFYDIYHQEDYVRVPEPDIPTATTLTEPMRPHLEAVLAYVDVKTIRAAGLKVAVDCCNGVGALHTRAFLEHLGCKVVTCCDTPNGIFEREPEPLPEHLGQLCDLTRRENCAIGFAQDPDGDRLALVNELGQPIGEDLTVALAVRQVLDHHATGPVVVHLSTSRSVRAVAEARGMPVHLSKIGEINVTEMMLERQAVVGGEGNGGVIIPAVHPCRDSYTAMAIVLELLAMTGKTVSELRAEIPRYIMLKDKLAIQSEAAVAILRRIRRQYEGHNVSLVDGVHVDLGDRWFHTRLSNTEPVLRITVEAPDQQGAEVLMNDIRRQVVDPTP
ncbi:MAG: phosphoglucosamine mutase [Verrucomicrobia bacterium]|nr:phosphoglucosamine mutase [Verrucomicrobiota bacterium]